YGGEDARAEQRGAAVSLSVRRTPLHARYTVPTLGGPTDLVPGAACATRISTCRNDRTQRSYCQYKRRYAARGRHGRGETDGGQDPRPRLRRARGRDAAAGAGGADGGLRGGAGGAGVVRAGDQAGERGPGADPVPAAAPAHDAVRDAGVQVPRVHADLR